MKTIDKIVLKKASSNASMQHILTSHNFNRSLSLIHLRHNDAQSVSYYTLFKGWLLLVKPPDCLCTPTSFITQRSFRGLLPGCFPLDDEAYPPSSHCRHWPLLFLGHIQYSQFAKSKVLWLCILNVLDSLWYIQFFPGLVCTTNYVANFNTQAQFSKANKNPSDVVAKEQKYLALQVILKFF